MPAAIATSPLAPPAPLHPWLPPAARRVLDDRANDVRRLRADRDMALAQARAWLARAAEHRAAGRRDAEERALWWARRKRWIARSYGYAAALREIGRSLVAAMSTAGLHTGAG